MSKGCLSDVKLIHPIILISSSKQNVLTIRHLFGVYMGREMIAWAVMFALSAPTVASAETDVSSLLLDCQPSRIEQTSATDCTTTDKLALCKLFTNTGSLYNSAEIITESSTSCKTYIYIGAAQAVKSTNSTTTNVYCNSNGYIRSSTYKNTTSSRTTGDYQTKTQTTTTWYCTGTCIPSTYKDQYCHGQNTYTTTTVN